MLLKFHNNGYTKIHFLFAICITTGFYAYGQNLIGYKGNEIKKYMAKNFNDMNSEKVVNRNYKYFRYTNNYDSQTFLFFLDKDSVCKSVRLIFNNFAKTAKVKELDSIYQKNGENRWIDKRDSISYIVRLIEEKWSYAITIDPDN